MRTGRTPDEVALLRVVEHLADAPDGDADEDGTAPVAATDGEAPEPDATPGPSGLDTPADAAEPAATAVPADEVGPVAAALSDTRHTIEELHPTEQVFLAQQRALIAELCPDPSDPHAVGALFDRVRAQWTEAVDRPDAAPLADAFGIALGDLVCAQAPDLHWATSSDRFGTEIVLARRDPEVLVYPVAAVAQAWETATPGWFVAHLTNVVRAFTPEPAPTDA